MSSKEQSKTAYAVTVGGYAVIILASLVACGYVIYSYAIDFMKQL